MFRTLIAFALAFTAFTLRAQEPQPPALIGKVEGNIYISPTGQFKVTIPVLPELGGTITDTPNVVTFQDDFNVHVSIAAFAQDATQRWEMSTRGLKDYLVYFFSNFVFADFRQNFEGAEIESAKFVPGMLDGALVTNLLVPGGTMFAERLANLGTSDRVPVAKRGNLLFVRNGYIFVVSTELAERVIEGRAYKKTTQEEDDALLQKLNDIIGKLQLLRVTTPPPAPAASGSSTPTITVPSITPPAPPAEKK
jgi:hypothetical protein